jgi:diguanylate cyclase (GGDEF)-like protein
MRCKGLRRWLLVTLFACCIDAFAAPAQDFDFGERYFETVGSVDDIPYGMVTRMVQDPSGLIWLGTQSGLLRFDGYRFRRFVHEPGNRASLSGDFVQALAVDRDGRVWVGTESDGVSVLDPGNDRFVRFRHDPDQADGIGPGTIHAIAVAPDAAVWIAADVGLQRYDPQTRRFSTWLGERAGRVPDARLRVQSLLFAGDGTLWIGTRDGLARVRPGSGAVERFTTRGATSLAGREVSTLALDSSGQLWIGTREHGAARVDPSDGRIQWIGGEHAQAADLARAWVNAIVQPSPDEIWLSRFGEGVVIVDRASGQVRHLLRNEPSVPTSLGFDAIGQFLIDRAGLLWVGTWGGGLQRHNPRNRAIRLLRHSPTQPSRLSHPSVLRILELADGRILAGTTGNGIDIIDRRRGVVGGWRANAADPGALANATVSGLVEARDGTLWVGTYQAGVHRLPAGGARFRRYGREHGLPTQQIEYLYIDAADQLWVGTGDGLVRYERESDRFVELRDAEGRAQRMRVNQIAQEADGRMWIATSSGLYAIEPGGAQLRAMVNDAADSRSISSDHVLSVLVDSRGRIWVDTAKGLDRHERDGAGNDVFVHVSTELGISGVSFGGNLLEDRRGRIWSPLYLYDPATALLYALHRADGLDIGAQWNGSSAATRDGHLLFGGSAGIAIIVPEAFEPWRGDPRVVVSGVNVDGREQPLGVIANGLTLAPGQRRFGFEFSATDLAAPQSNRYEYRLLGYEDDWVAVDADHRHAAFSNLWPGRYTLELRARNRVGDASTLPTRVPIRVLPSFWQTGWFLFAVLAVVVASVVVLLRWFSARYRARARALAALVEERTAELRVAHAAAERASLTDPLTGLGNRRSLEASMPAQVQALAQVSKRHGDVAGRLALLVIDIDEFKAVNDRLGHRAGDQVISGVAHLIRQQLRERDIAVRFGGEEFLVVAHVESATEAWQLAERLRRAVAAHRFDVEGGSHAQQTISIGGALLPFDLDAPQAIGWEQVIEISDAAMYFAKRDGRDRCCALVATAPLPADFIARFRADPERAISTLPLALVRIARG